MFLPSLLFGQPLEEWFYRGLVILVISCPCALVLSTPVSVVSAISGGARRGVLFKGGLYLERMGDVKVVAFDKTGTLTSGRTVVERCPVRKYRKGGPQGRRLGGETARSTSGQGGDGEGPPEDVEFEQRDLLPGLHRERAWAIQSSIVWCMPAARFLRERASTSRRGRR